ncbi:histidine phosphatase family protein [Actinomarinicola tropica]|uniref:Histidine phosphatase family protein n=1 Tax=Actinomarinicola tropica TaxID=2789776 RepID=A0A5Q2RAS1_9ACTN|nr:histidine phosphatase family protein [Actinomarinicola tropica]QGG93918.1 histidine phosphatase family protein [Actinomarinicola tropica]
MPVLRYITHPDVVPDPDVLVPEWRLSPTGVARARAMAAQPWVEATGRVVSSPENKARAAAAILAERLHLVVEVRPDTGEIDRSSTGYLPAEEHEAHADRFFALPDVSTGGWERAADAQERVHAALADLLVPGEADVAVVGHGAVGTLWYCRLTGQPIDRRHDQPGQGHYFTVDLVTREVLHPWRPIDAD